MKEALGTIQVDNDVIAKVAGSVAIATSGIVGMAMLNIKSGIWEILKRENLTKGVRISRTYEDKIILTFNVIVAYGTNIATVADNLIENVQYQVEKFTGMEIEKINIIVESVRVRD